MVTDKNSSESITIDTFLKGKQKKNLFIKMDIEGEEVNALKGMEKTLNETQGRVLSVCTYHKPNDPEDIYNFLKKLGYISEFNHTGRLFLYNRIVEKVLLRSHK